MEWPLYPTLDDGGLDVLVSRCRRDCVANKPQQREVATKNAQCRMDFPEKAARNTASQVCFDVLGPTHPYSRCLDSVLLRTCARQQRLNKTATRGTFQITYKDEAIRGRFSLTR